MPTRSLAKKKALAQFSNLSFSVMFLLQAAASNDTNDGYLMLSNLAKFMYALTIMARANEKLEESKKPLIHHSLDQAKALFASHIMLLATADMPWPIANEFNAWAVSAASVIIPSMVALAGLTTWAQYCCQRSIVKHYRASKRH